MRHQAVWEDCGSKISKCITDPMNCAICGKVGIVLKARCPKVFNAKSSERFLTSFFYQKYRILNNFRYFWTSRFLEFVLLGQRRKVFLDLNKLTEHIKECNAKIPQNNNN